MLLNAGIHFPSHVSMIRLPIRCDMALSMPWMALICRAIFSGPVRTEDNSFWCIDAWKGDWVQLDRCGYMAPVGIEQFFDAFSLDPKRPWRTAACQVLGIPAGHIAEDTHINPSEGSKFTLTQDAYLSSDGQLQRKTLLM